MFEGLACWAPGSRAASWPVLRSAAALPAMGGRAGGNSLEGETKVRAGAMGSAAYRAQVPT